MKKIRGRKSIKGENRMKIIFLSGIFAYFFLLVGAGSVFAQGATLSFSPASESYLVGNDFYVQVKIDTGGLPVNAASGVIYFPANKLEVLEISEENSIFTFWPQEPVFSNDKGWISFAGGLPHPGFSGSGEILTLRFKGKEEFVANLALFEGRVLADDGKGTDILFFIKEAKYYLQSGPFLAEAETTQIFSPTHPFQDDWYNNDSPVFQWLLPQDAAGVSFVLDRNSETAPDMFSEGIFQSTGFEGLADGIWYFHLRLESGKEWLAPSHYKIKIDSVPPRPFEVVIDNNGDPTNPRPNLYFETSDKTSGIDHYKLRLGDGDFINLFTAQVNPFALPFQKPGLKELIVRAVDKAGNIVESEARLEIKPIESPEITVFPQLYTAGEEPLYIEGRAIPSAEITVFLKDNGKEIGKWQTFSNERGEWSFSTKKLIPSGVYSLSALAKDGRGAVSLVSESRSLAVSLSGFSFGSLIVSLRAAAWFLFFLIVLGAGIAVFIVYKTQQEKKNLKEEVSEAREMLRQTFAFLRENLKKRLEMFDAKPGFNEREREVYDELLKNLNLAEDFIGKEIEDIQC